MANIAMSDSHLIRSVTGVILAGGKSSRFGKNKAFIPINGVVLIERVAAVMASVFESRLIVTNTPEEYAYLGIPIVQDLIRGVGPLGGIYTGLATIPRDSGFFVACDMPYLCPELIHYIAGLGPGYDAVVPRIGRMVEPLHSLYAKSSLAPLKEIIDSGGRQILELFSRVKVRYVEEETLRGFVPDLRCLANVNRPEDLARVTDDGKAGPQWPGKSI